MTSLASPARSQLWHDRLLSSNDLEDPHGRHQHRVSCRRCAKVTKEWKDIKF